MKIQAVRGMNDILPEQTLYWQWLENQFIQLMKAYGYQEIRLPIVEKTELFKRAVGEATDIVEKEMYAFHDRNDDNLCLRPEGTAGCVRATIEHGLLHHQTQRLWYKGPMFRRERPQQGRYRQFHHFGVESFGFAGPDIDAELLCMTARFWQQLGISDHLSLQLNSLGSKDCRQRYRAELVHYLQTHRDQLDEDCKRRLITNPLRILDSKNPEVQVLLESAPSLLDYLDEPSQRHFDGLRTLLDRTQIHYQINPRLVRGLDYYDLSVFEWVTQELGAQGTVCAGGRYNGLVAELNEDKSVPAMGFAIGIERLMALLEKNRKLPDLKPAKAYLIMVGDQATQQGLLIAEQLREQLPALQLITHCGGGNFKNQFKHADKSGAKWAFILGDDELEKNKISIKYLREERPQENLSLTELINRLKEKTT